MTTCSNCGHEAEATFTYCPTCGTQAIAQNERGMAGRVLAGKYRVIDRLGAGSMGTVYLGEHVSLKKRIALKVLHKELQVGEEAWKRFQREGIAAGQVNHPNAIQIFDFDRTDEGLCFLAMEHVEGDNLKQWLDRQGPMAADTAISVFRQLLATLAEAHRHGIVHRDLKPENLMVHAGADGSLQLKVLDFGLSKLVDRPLDASLLTMSGRVMGTPLYMSPEQWNGQDVDPRSDLYSAALILYEMLSGKQPFKGSNLTETLVKSTTEPPPSLLTEELREPLPVDLDALVLRGLAKEREERFQSAAEMLEALDQVRLDRVSRGGRPVRKRPARKQPTRRGAAPARSRMWIAAAMAGAALIVLAVAWWGGGGSRPAAPLVSMLPAESRSEAETAYVSLLDEARDRMRAGEFASARAVVDKATRHPSADAEALALRAAVFRRQHDLDAAEQDYLEALGDYPGYAVAEAGLGWIALDRGDRDTAESKFRSAMAMDRDTHDGTTGMAALLVQRAEHAAARELLEPAVAKFPDAAELHLWHAEALLGLGDLDGAVQSFVQAKRKDPSLWQALAGLGDTYARKGDVDAARQQYAGALEIAPDNHRLRGRLAELLLDRELYRDARTTLQPALQGTQQDGRLHVLDGLSRLGLGEVADGIAALERGLELGIDEPAPIHLLVATNLLALERWKDALDHADRAVAADPGLAAGYRCKGLAAFRLADFDRAAEHFARAVELDGDDLLARHSLGVLYMDYLERPDDAAAQLRAYRERGGDDPMVDGWLRRLER